MTIEIKHRVTGAILRTVVGANLRDAYLYGANLRDANLYGADLRGAYLCDADLCDADLRGAYLRDANLCGAYLSGAYLSGADLRGANLYGADLRGADLTSLRDALDCGSPHGWRIVIVRHDDGIRIAAGCRWMTFAEASAYWDEQGSRKLLSGPLLAYIKAAAAIKGWTL